MEKNNWVQWEKQEKELKLKKQIEILLDELSKCDRLIKIEKPSKKGK
jgi:hypothetical protein